MIYYQEIHRIDFIYGTGIAIVVLVSVIISVQKVMISQTELYDLSDIANESCGNPMLAGLELEAINEKRNKRDLLLAKLKVSRRSLNSIMLTVLLLGALSLIGVKSGLGNFTLISFFVFIHLRIQVWGQLLLGLYCIPSVMGFIINLNLYSHLILAVIQIFLFILTHKVLTTFFWTRMVSKNRSITIAWKPLAPQLFLGAILFLISIYFINPEKNILHYIAQKIELIQLEKKESVLKKQLAENILPVSQSKNSNLHLTNIDTKFLNTAEMDLSLKSDYKLKELEEITNQKHTELFDNLKKSNGSAQVARIETLMEEIQQLNSQIENRMNGSSNTKNIKQYLKTSRDFMNEGRKQLEQLKLMEDIDRLNSKLSEGPKRDLISIDSHVEAQEQAQKILDENYNNLSSDQVQQLENVIQQSAKKNKAVLNYKREKRFHPSWINKILIFIFVVLVVLFKKLFSQKKIIIDDVDLDDEVKKKIIQDYKNLPRKFSSFMDEVRQKYCFFHRTIEEINYNKELAPPAIALARDIQIQNLSRVAFDLGNTFNLVEFSNQEKFSRTEVRKFRQCFKFFIKYLNSLLKS